MLEMIAFATTHVHIAALDQDFLIFATIAPKEQHPVA